MLGRFAKPCGDDTMTSSQATVVYLTALESAVSVSSCHRRQSWGVGGRDPQILKWGSWRGLGVVEGVVSGLLRSKGEGREPRIPPVFKPD
jgi:hypothetical protein